MDGTWVLDTANQKITFIRSLSRKEKRRIPQKWIRKHKDGSFTLVPVTYPVIEFTKRRLVLYD
jgi:hypothetical protein